jgi:hypothetical protein
MFQRPQLLAVRRRRVLDSLVAHVVESCVPAVIDLVSGRLKGMTLCEARGYVRARAGREIRRQARMAFSNQPGVDPSWESLVVLRASEKVAPVVLRQLSGMRNRESEVVRRVA